MVKLPSKNIGWGRDGEADCWNNAIERAAMLQSGNFRENENSSTKLFRENAETSTNSPAYPETLPCDVKLVPGVKIGKGCPTTTLFLALNSRAANVAALEAITPEERKEHDAAIDEFREMLGISTTNSPV
ncbi:MULTISPECIES: hypothetical protein [Symbiopectobacterium]|uniref:hypothetical protein n=1 Tax=Symbiopectobacterium TaxID=801 RepID=UPI001A1A76E2|nr:MULTISPECIES: hypothetical protein [Symbiopectobacterium]MBG6248356.1 hypothetical protein [Candidatus Symbiopectobacterium sp. PLON1]MBT9430267.1 hypothetical protein [Candidatus Symbiopectobacterium endolongispinus]